jgi:membrane protease YdiL (CAAX protease family)
VGSAGLETTGLPAAQAGVAAEPLGEPGVVPSAQAWVAFDARLAVAALVPLAVALLAAFLQPLRLAALLVAVAGTVLAGRRRTTAVWAWAAIVPVTAILAWGMLPAPRALPALASCATFFSPPMLWRVAELGVILALIAVLARWLAPAPRHIPRARVHQRLVALAGTTALVVAPLAVVMGEEASHQFFGSVRIEIGLAGAILPALIFAFANATLEETVYRGVLLGWLEPALGTTGAIMAQAAAFGLAHNGLDYVASPWPVILAMFATGAIAGFIVKRTGSLFIPIVIHAAFDVALYYGLACRIS